MDYVGKFASMLTVARTRQGKSVQRLAKEMRISPSKIRHWEAGDYLPKEKELPKIQSGYDLSNPQCKETYLAALSELKTQRKTLSLLGKNTVPKKKSTEELFSGGIEVSSNMSRLNRPGGGKGSS